MTTPVQVPIDVTVLDFDPELTCEVLVGTPENMYPCGDVARYFISVTPPCGHLDQVYICETCWAGAPTNNWACTTFVDGAMCMLQYLPLLHVHYIERV